MTGRDHFINKFEEVCNKNPNKIAITYLQDNGSTKNFTFNDIKHQAKQMAKNLKSANQTPGDRTAILSPLSPHCYIAYFAIAYAGLTAVIIDPQLPDTEKDRLLTNADIRSIITTENIHKTYTYNVPAINIQNGQILNTAPPQPPTQDPDPEAAAILYSSGTTSQAKGVVIGYHQQLKSADINLQITGTNNIRWLAVYPFFHISGLSSFLAVLLNGAQLGLIENVNAAKLQEAFQNYKPNTFALVPKVYTVFEEKIKEAIKAKGPIPQRVIFSLMRLSGFIRKHTGLNPGKHLFASINKQLFGGNMVFLGVGGGPSNPKTIEFFLQLGYVWFNIYASTEANVPITSTTHKDRYPVGSSGNVNRFPNINIKIANPNPSGEGEILVKSDMIMKGYFREPELTAAAFDQEGYFKTGDLGYINNKDELRITGRAKEAILLHNGEKVSPDDIEHVYSRIINGPAFACAGVPHPSGTYDTTHLFIENTALHQNDTAKLQEKILSYSVTAGSNYTISKVHFIDKLPLTSIGKVKRYALQKTALSEAETTPAKTNKMGDIKSTVLEIVSNLVLNKTITPASSLKQDLGIDSLTMMELYITLENTFNITIKEGAANLVTVQDLINAVTNGGSKDSAKAAYNITQYPKMKTKSQARTLKTMMNLSRKIWRFEVSGTQHIPQDKNYILCPNHQSRLDAMMTWAAIENADINKICCLVAQELLVHPVYKRFLPLLGGIPTDRHNNPAPAYKRCLESIKDGYQALIHPEGTVTKDGNMNEFKGGAAKLAIDAGVEIIPVRIEGTRTIWRLYTIFPKLFNWRKMRRHTISISFGKPISPQGKTVEEITAQLRAAVEALGNGK